MTKNKNNKSTPYPGKKWEGQQFVVKTEKGLLYVLSAICFLLFLTGAYLLIKKRFQLDWGDVVFFFFLVASILFFIKANDDQVIIRINKEGIFYYERLVTNWKTFIKAYVRENPTKKVTSISDQFQLVIEFTKDDPKNGFRKKIPLTNTQNQSEENILTAIKYFWHLYANENKLI